MVEKFLSIGKQYRELDIPLDFGIETHFEIVFFLETLYYYKSRENYNLLNLFSDVGGIFGLLVSAGALVNHRFAKIEIQGRFASSLFRVPSRDLPSHSSAADKINWLESI